MMKNVTTLQKILGGASLVAVALLSTANAANAAQARFDARLRAQQAAAQQAAAQQAAPAAAAAAAAPVAKKATGLAHPDLLRSAAAHAELKAQLAADRKKAKELTAAVAADQAEVLAANEAVRLARIKVAANNTVENQAALTAAQAKSVAATRKLTADQTGLDATTAAIGTKIQQKQNLKADHEVEETALKEHQAALEEVKKHADLNKATRAAALKPHQTAAAEALAAGQPVPQAALRALTQAQEESVAYMHQLGNELGSPAALNRRTMQQLWAHMNPEDKDTFTQGLYQIQAGSAVGSPLFKRLDDARLMLGIKLPARAAAPAAATDAEDSDVD